MQTLDPRMYPVVSVGTKPPLVHFVEALNQEYCCSITKFLPETPWFATKARPPRLTSSSWILWSRFPLRSFSMKDGGLHVPWTRSSMPLHTKSEGRRLVGVSKTPRDRHTEIQAWFTRGPAHKAQRLALSLSHALSLSLSLSRANLALTLSNMC